MSLTATQEKVLAALRASTPPGCESCKHNRNGYCESRTGCDWVGEMFFGHANRWAGYERDDAKLTRVAMKLGDKLDHAEVTRRFEKAGL